MQSTADHNSLTAQTTIHTANHAHAHEQPLLTTAESLDGVAVDTFPGSRHVRLVVLPALHRENGRLPLRGPSEDVPIDFARSIAWLQLLGQRLRTRGVVIHFVVVVVVFARWVEAAEAFLRRKRPPVLELQELVVRDDMRHVVARIADGVHEPLLNAAWAELSHGAA